VLDFSKIEAGRTELNPAPFDLHEHLAAVLESAEVEARRKGLALSVWIAPDVPFAVTGDWPHLRQVLTNLLANAIKFTADGGVALTVELAADDDTDEGAVTVVFEVADTGVGIAPEHFERIFEGFTQADESVARRFGGTGLGLAIARQLVELMGGRIDVRSVVEGGSVFTVRLPLVVADEAGGPVREPAPCSCILIARDSELIATVTRVLTPTSTLSIVATLDAARRAIAADGCEYHVVLIEAGQVAAETGMPALRASCPGHRLGFVMVDARAEPPHGAWEFVSTVSPSAPPAQFHRVVHAAMAFSGALTATADAGLRRASRRTGLRVLVAEDQELNRTLIEKILRTADHLPRLVVDGEQALEALAEGGFDVAILDVNMPRMSGIDVAKLHRMSELGDAPTPLVALSADATLDTRRLCEEAGIDAYLTKPIEAGQLLDTIDRLVGGSLEAVEGATESDPLPSDALRLTSPQPAPVPPRSAVIADIAHHPLYGGAPTGVIDRKAVRNLDLIGGPEFVRGIVRDYVADAAELIGRIGQAVDSRDQPRLREECHALRSSSSNVGARAICQLCNELHGIDEEHLAGDAADRVGRLQVELEVYRAEMDRYVAELMRRGAGGL
jgi:two-component system, sensor histidine kinase RpfC